MSPKCIKISICVCFLFFSFVLFGLAFTFLAARNHVIYFPSDSDLSFRNPTLTFQDQYGSLVEVRQVNLRDMSSDSENGTLNTPSLEAYIGALSGEEGQKLRLSGLALYSKLANACQPLVDISKSKFQGNKIALVSLDELSSPVCTLLGLAINAQNGGYSVLIFYVRSAPWFSDGNGMQTDNKDKLLIPVLYASDRSDLDWDTQIDDADRRKVDISVQTGSGLTSMRVYLSSLYFWFLLGPVITLEWLRRKKRLFFMSGALQQDHEESAGDDRSVRNVDEGGLHSEALESVTNYDQETEHYQTGGDEQPLIVAVNDPRFNLATGMRQRTSIRVVVLFRKIFGKLAVGSGYVILIVVALPVGISSGGWSFFRFDENEKLFPNSFWDDLLYTFNASDIRSSYWYKRGNGIVVTIIDSFLPLWWSSLQVFCFFLYSRFACKTTWTVPSNSSKLIRSDWFASNMYLLILGVVVPFCSFTMADIWYFLFGYFAAYNMVCTICNLFFIIILNKHKFVTGYVFYISVCMICAYVESDIVAVYYFIMNSEGLLTNLKLTALRTVAIGLTLTLSLSSSMHIIRKLTKPQESLFEGLSEK